MLELSIVIPVFNCLALTQACMKSVEETIGARADFEVIIVDNASSDGTREWLSTLPEPRYRVIRHEKNLGYAAANNAAARIARGRLLLLLNNDTVLLPGWLDPMLRVLGHAERAGVVGNIQREAESGLIDHAGILFTLEGVPLHFGKGTAAPPAGEYGRFPAVTGACCLLRRDLFTSLGGFSEDFQNCYEDVDLCLRLRQDGLVSYVANQSVIYHHVSATVGRHQNDLENFAKFGERWGATISGLAEIHRQITAKRTQWTAMLQSEKQIQRERRQDGWRYLQKHVWRPWRYNAGRLRHAFTGILSRPPAPPRVSVVEPFFFE
jgi:GT2 family glycosyltransferase